ncbi:class I SAM-dependent methyltransferase [Vibrio vulnificus]|uniref:Class I SAM-dependent methyltransferase n=1 Tax=Vibrio vulnificus TaxID=672 RepID=A0AAW4HJ32_VIBVL|nr:class I SAM-dependent methyltransferase [Vibrio vulnificus]ELA3117890.1 class I SAM-dependent methyltransferase [Vibrio vulnificus]MBN8124526.1 class I SAM-dependent methyltransferase [Vibrio vulnificus]
MDDQNHRENWRKFYEKALNRPHSTRTERAVSLDASSIKVAIDCGCGTGSDIKYLTSQGYKVFGFDINPESIAICRDRFGDELNVNVVQSSFCEFEYADASLIIANASLFFVDPAQFQAVWTSIDTSLVKGGVFAGDFMGKNDSWANDFHAPITTLAKDELLNLFSNFDIIEFNERDEDGTTMVGDTKHWHIYSVVAVKRT